MVNIKPHRNPRDLRPGICINGLVRVETDDAEEVCEMRTPLEGAKTMKLTTSFVMRNQWNIGNGNISKHSLMIM